MQEVGLNLKAENARKSSNGNLNWSPRLSRETTSPIKYYWMLTEGVIRAQLFDCSWQTWTAQMEKKKKDGVQNCHKMGGQGKSTIFRWSFWTRGVTKRTYTSVLIGRQRKCVALMLLQTNKLADHASSRRFVSIADCCTRKNCSVPGRNKSEFGSLPVCVISKVF